MLEILLSFVISFLIGLLVGLEHEHSHTEGTQPIGVRTFILLSLLGTISATLHQFILTIMISAFVLIIITLGYFRSTSSITKKIDLGITTQTTAIIVFCLGYMVPSANLIAIIISALVLLVLIERKRLHFVARKKFKSHEIETAVIFLIFLLGILPILPNHTIDPWQLINPRNLGILIATIAGIQFTGYITIRLFGERFGMPITGFLGGFISSTIVFLNLNHTLLTHPRFLLTIIASAILAILAMLIEIMTIIFVASPTFFFYTIKPILSMIITCIVSVIILLHFQKRKIRSDSSAKNPINILSILRTSIFLTVILIIVALTKRFVGNEGVLLVSFLGGLFEIHGITLATALLYLDQHLSINTASLVLYAAILASFLSKVFLLWTLTPHRFALQTTFFLVMILCSGGLTYVILH